jgi:hypothetical protein
MILAPTATGTVSYALTCAGAGGSTTATSATVTVAPSLLSALATFTMIGSTIDPTATADAQGGNPYGLAIAPLSSGLISAGDLIVCNFNNAAGTQGAGTTMIGLHASAGSTPYQIAQSTQLLGCNAVTMLPDNSIAATAYSANAFPLVSSAGTVSMPFAAGSFAEPWGTAFVAATGTQPAALYVTNVGPGGGAANIVRITLDGDTPTGFTQIAAGFCGSGSPGAIYAPAGLTYDPSIDTLYIVDTSSYSVVAFSSVSTIGSNGIIVNGSCGGSTPTPALSFSGPQMNLARVIASGGQFNAPISAALLADGDLIVGNGDIDNPAITNLAFEISPALGFVGAPLQLDTGAPGALFGIVATTDASGNQIIYFNDDNANAVFSLTR